jgi:hypothetical protein
VPSSFKFQTTLFLVGSKTSFTPASASFSVNLSEPSRLANRISFGSNGITAKQRISLPSLGCNPFCSSPKYLRFGKEQTGELHVLI